MNDRLDIELDHHDGDADGHGDAGDRAVTGEADRHAATRAGWRAAALVGGAIAVLLAGFALGRAGAGGDDDGRADTAEPTELESDAAGVDETGDAAERPLDDATLLTLPPPSESDPELADEPASTVGSEDGSTDGAASDAASDAAADRDPDAASDADTEPDIEVEGPPPVRFDDLGGPLLPEPTGLVVVGLTGDGDLVEIDVDRGHVRTTDLDDATTAIGTGGAMRVVALPEATLVGRFNGLPGQRIDAVPLGDPPSRAPSVVERATYDPLIAAPGDRHVWLAEYPEDPATSADVDGYELVPVDVVTGDSGPGAVSGGRETWIAGGTGDGRALVQTIGGVYEVGEDGARRISTGRVSAIGANHVVATECDDELRCSPFRIDRASGERTPVEPGSPIGRFGPARLSPDGAAAVTFELRPPDGRGWFVVDLDGDERRQLDVREYEIDPASTAFAWTADSRFVVHLAQERLAVLDRETGTVVEAGGDTSPLPDLVTFDVRRAGPEPMGGPTP